MQEWREGIFEIDEENGERRSLRCVKLASEKEPTAFGYAVIMMRSRGDG